MTQSGAVLRRAIPGASLARDTALPAAAHR